MRGLWAKIGGDWFFPAAILLTLFLLATASPLTPVSPESDRTWLAQDYSRMINLEEAPAFPAFLFRMLTIVFLTLLLSGLVINLQGWLQGGWRIFPPGPPVRVPWGIGPVVKLAVYFIALFLLLLRIEKILLGLIGISPAEIESRLMLLNAFLQFSLLLGLGAVFRIRYRGESAGVPAAALCDSPFSPVLSRFSAGGELRNRVRQAFRGYICFFPLLVTLILISWAVTQYFDLPWQSHPLVGPLLEKDSPQLIWPLLLIGVILGPLAEEMFFRGLLFPPLAKLTGGWWSVLITAALFATLHLNWAGWLPIFGLGVLLARAYQQTGSLLVPVLIHSLHNALFLSFTILFYLLTST